MSELILRYKSIYSKLDELNSQLNSLDKERNELKKKKSEDISVVKQLLADQKIDILNKKKQIRGFIGIAETHTTACTPATMPKEYNRSVLSGLLVQIGNKADDPYARQLYAEATAQMLYLNNQEEELQEKADAAVNIIADQYKEKERELMNKLAEVSSAIFKFLPSAEVSGFLNILEKNQQVFNADDQKSVITKELYGTLSVGTVSLPIPIPKGMEKYFDDGFRGMCDITKSSISVPANISLGTGKVFVSEYNNKSESYTLRGVQNIIINIVRHYSERFTGITFIDPVRYNASALDNLSAMCGEECFIESVPATDDEVKKKITKILSELSNKENGDEQNTGKGVYIFHDFPQSYDSSSVDLIQQLCANANYYGIVVILTHNKSSDSHANNAVYKYIRNIASNIVLKDNGKLFFEEKDLPESEFDWYLPPSVLPGDVRQKCVRKKKTVDLDNFYENRVGFELTKRYLKGERKIDNIPYGVDSSGNILYLDFEDTRFATYICGASRSGKSTLLHTIITGILKSTHPDNIEIWLVDFGKTEFSRYANKDIPHIRYIILDQSPELVYDLVDRLTEIMKSRENRYMSKWEKLSDVPAEEYMPEIFVVIDEFSIMSNVLAGSVAAGKEDYRIKLQTILAKSAKLGIRFIFSSQGFNEGSRGLTDLAKDQIQQRIAMKADYSDIKSTLELQTISERDAFIMEQLQDQPEYALRRIPLTSQGNRLSKAHVLYIPSAEKQMMVISRVKEAFYPGEDYDPSDYGTYIYKCPMLKDGNSFEIFEERRASMAELLEQSDTDYDEKTISLFIGSPQRMLKILPIKFSDSFCENGLIIAPKKEKMSAASLVLSALASLKMQRIKTECWTLKNNPIYRHITDKCELSFDSSFVRTEDICKRISEIKNAIKYRIPSDSVIFISNYETIMMDMQFISEEAQNAETLTTDTTATATIGKREEGEKDIQTILFELNAGIADEQIVRQIDEQNLRKAEAPAVKKQNSASILSEAYDAREDLKYIITHGPKLGYHFIMLFDTCGDFSQTKLNSTSFRHRIMFQTPRSEVIGIVNSSMAEEVSDLSSHLFRYTDGLEAVSFRPYLHKGIHIDGWSIPGETVVNAQGKKKIYLE